MGSELPDRILVTGATGAIGSRVVQLLHEAGCNVRTLSRNRPENGLFPQSVDVRTGDVVDASCVRSAVIDVDIVFHLAAMLHIVNPSPDLRKEYDRVNIDGTATVVEAAKHAGVRRVVYFSTIAVYGPSEGRVLTEASRPHPDTYYAETKLAGEQIVLDAKRFDGEALGTVLRLGAAYGSRVKANYFRLVQSLSSRRFIPLGKGLNRRTLVYDRDVAQAALVAALHPRAIGELYNVTDGQFHTVDEIIKTICKALSRFPPRLVLPVVPSRIMIGLLEDCARRAGFRFSIVRGTVDKYTEDIAVSGNKIQAELGFVPRFDLLAGWQEAIREMRLSGCL